MSISLKQSGVWRSAQGLFVKVNGEWKLVDQAYEKVGGVWTTFHKNVIEATVTSGVGLIASTVFSAADWASSTPKKIIIPAGVTIGSNSPGAPAVNINAGFGGLLTIENAGTILGAGGVANSGVGGTALLASQAIKLVNNGNIYGGGGGGGHGGAGGGGYYHTTENSGWQYSAPNTMVSGTYNQYKAFRWGGAYLGQAAGNPASLGHGGYTYYMGSTRGYADGNAAYYEIRRQRTLTHYTSGGSGGAGGRGQGYNHALAGGGAPAGGGTNAGTGGWGGAGGGWGANGAGGANGGGGNNGGGAAGAGGGLAGYALQGLGNITLENSGSILGRQA